jgi:hypothetical protein
MVVTGLVGRWVHSLLATTKGNGTVRLRALAATARNEVVHPLTLAATKRR